jgi:hypothetical protein
VVRAVSGPKSIAVVIAGMLLLTGCGVGISDPTGRASDSQVQLPQVLSSPPAGAPIPGPTPQPCQIPRTSEGWNGLTEIASAVALVSATTSTPDIVSDMQTQRVEAFPVTVERIIWGDTRANVQRVLFDVAPQSQPLPPGRYVLFLAPAPDGAPGDFYVVYGLRGSYHVDAQDQVFPRCINNLKPGTAVDGQGAVPLSDLQTRLASVPVPNSVAASAQGQ